MSALSSLVIVHCSLIRHSGFVIRHFVGRAAPLKTSNIYQLHMHFLSKLFSRLAPAPVAGELTPSQGVAQTGIGIGQVPGFIQPTQGTYHLYRRMSAHPTLALARAIVTAPILAAGWGYEGRRPGGRADREPRGGAGRAGGAGDRRPAGRAAGGCT